MGKIIELSQHVSNQIAAGEVVERPSSVIKELLENALDAEATTIEIRIKNGGFDHIIIQDDGVGMDETDIKLSVKRYATSKLSSVSDLDRLHTFGFRGEALPSIASISLLSILSRPQGEAHGTKAIIEGGTFKETLKSGASFGTRIEVRDLFYNVPARLKFAKSKRVETFEIDRLIKAFAFVHTDISFRLFVDDKLVFSTQNTDELTRAQALLGVKAKEHLFLLKRDLGGLKLDGVIAAPMAQRRDMRGILFFVNERLVNDRKLIIALKSAFRSLIEVGHHPVCALKITIAPDEVDVNVHPRKAEVRFRDEKTITSAIMNEIIGFLSKTPWLSSSQTMVSSMVPPRNFTSFSTPERLEVPYRPRNEEILPSNSFNYSFSLSQKNNSLSFDLPNEKPLLSAANFLSLRVIGQVCLTYILAEGVDGLVIIDQHAAHERVMYEKIRKKKEIGASSTRLLIPLSFPVDYAFLALLNDYQQDLKDLGFDIEKFDEESVVVRALPDFISPMNVETFIQALISDLTHHGRLTTAEELFHHFSATLACHSSIRAGQRLNKEEIEALLVQLDGVDFHAHCPHGRPIVKSFSAQDMKKWFDRT